ncbi:MAG: RidA family protein [Pseudolysinimonas sp.]
MSTRDSYGGVTAGRATPLFPAVVAYGELVLLSGQAPLDPETGAVVGGGFRAQARQVLDGIRHGLELAGSGIGDVLRVVCILADAGDFDVWNEEFAEAFPEPRPVRTTFVAGFVLPGMLIEVEATAVRSSAA